MVHLIDELKVIPGVMGACLYQPQKGVLASNLPSIFKQERLEVVGRQLIKLQSAGRMSLAGGSDLQLCFEELMIVAREFECGTLVFALCEGGFNGQLLQMPLSLLEAEYHRHATAPTVVPVAAPVESEESLSTHKSVEAAAPANSDIDSAARAALVDELTGELSLLVGPMAGMIIEDVFDDWQQDTVADLVELICAELGDAGKSNQFRRSTAGIISKRDLKKG